MRVIITGGSGLIGRALAKSLTADVHEVIILSRSPERVVGLPAGVKVAGWDGRTAQGWGALADGADAIVNLAGETLDGGSFFPKRWNPERKQGATESRVQAGAAVTQAVEAARKKPEVVIDAVSWKLGFSHYFAGDVADTALGGEKDAHFDPKIG